MADNMFDEGVPAISFKNAPIGLTYSGVVTKAPEKVQMRDYNTGEPAVWPKDGNPKMGVVFNIELTAPAELAGEERSVWAAKPSSMYSALSAAQKKVGKNIDLGGTVDVAFIRQEESKDPKKEGQKIYAAQYTPPVAPPAGNAFEEPASTPEPSAPAASGGSALPPWMQ